MTSSPPIIVHQSPVALVSYSTNAGYIMVVWGEAAATEPELRAVYECVLHSLKRFRVRKVLSDHRQRPPMLPAVRQWIIHDWMPRAMLEAEHSHAAIVTTLPPSERLAALFTPLNALMETRYFATVAQADSWLRSQL